MKMDQQQLASTAAAIAEEWFTNSDVWGLLKKLPEGYDPDVAFESCASSMESLMRIRKLYNELNTLMKFDLERLNLSEQDKVQFLDELAHITHALEDLTGRIDTALGQSVVCRGIEMSYRGE